MSLLTATTDGRNGRRLSVGVSLAAAMFAGLLLGAGVGPAAEPDGNEAPSELLLEKHDNSPALPRLIHVTERVYCGAEPRGADAFAELQKMGVSTVVCVDGSTPDVDLAARYGLRYVHIPIGYDRIRQSESQSMVRVMRELATNKSVYVHCHHGRQRGPAVAAIAAVADTSISATEAIRVLELAGTSRTYSGLWRDVKRFQAPAPGATELPALRETVEVDQLTRLMAEMDRVWDGLKAARTKASRDEGWRELDRLLVETEKRAEFRSKRFGELLGRMRHETDLLGESLRKASPDTARWSARVSAVGRSCASCHQQFRDQ